MTCGCSCSLCRECSSGRRLPAPIPLGRPSGTYRREEPKRVSICTPFWSKVRKQQCCSKGHKDNAQSVTCVHKLLLIHMSVGSKFSEPSSTQQCGPCDACKFAECIFQCRGVIHESIRTPSCSNVARDIPISLQIVVESDGVKKTERQRDDAHPFIYTLHQHGKRCEKMVCSTFRSRESPLPVLCGHE